jgi:hypothetical protein
MAADERVGACPANRRAMSPLTEVFTRWATDPAYQDSQNRSLALSKTGAAPSFQDLAESLTRDVHPGSLLESLIRMGVVHEADDGRVCLSDAGFVPQGNLCELLGLFADNASDPHNKQRLRFGACFYAALT